MDISIQKSTLQNSQHIQITGSKSESNRLLLLQALYPEISIANVSNSDDTVLMKKALESRDKLIDIHHAGTAMRFLTAFFSIQKGREVVLTGSQRMTERPIKILVDALKSLGADIQYLKHDGFPPLKINGKTLDKPAVELKADVSSQYISALMLIASKLEQGLKIDLNGKITSVPYIKMTISLLKHMGIDARFKDHRIYVTPSNKPIEPKVITVESDWSSASYFYSIIALSAIGSEISLGSYQPKSLQGDSVLAEIYKNFGVETVFEGHKMRLLKVSPVQTKSLNLNLSDAPDIAQTLAVTAFGLSIPCYLSGLHTLKIKETDRLVALKTELGKLGADVAITNEALRLKVSGEIHKNKTVATYNDHRMAMAFAPLGLKTDLTIQNAEVVSKSYPSFWEDLESIGFNIK